MLGMKSTGKDSMNTTRIAQTALVLALLVVGCGRKAPENTEPFEKAIAVYCKKNSMDLRVARFRELIQDGSSATGVVSMEYAGEGVGMKIRWKVEFRRTNGVWEVVKHSS